MNQGKSKVLLIGAFVLVAVASALHEADTVASNGKDVEGAVCPGGRYSCRPGQTCCSIGGGRFGCCPYDSGICCADYRTCCPYGYRCNVGNHTCSKVDQPELAQEEEDASMIKPLPLKLSSTGSGGHDAASDETMAVESQTNGTDSLGGGKYCPDHRTVCGLTVPCCLHIGGAYGCCPYPYGVCCADYTTCCPYGTRCNLAYHRCDHL